MPIYEFGAAGIVRLAPATFASAGMQERRDLQCLLRDNIGVIAPDTLVIAEEFGDWQDSRRRIDLLAIDKEANLVVIELKRTEDGGHIELQAIRYAAMVARMTLDQAVEAYGEYLRRHSQEEIDPRTQILQFLEWDESGDGQFASDVRIILASSNFSKEITSTVLWLNEHELDIRCVRLSLYSLDSRLLVDVQQIIPLPEMADYLVQVREKAQKERQARASAIDFTHFDVRIGGTHYRDLTKRHAFLTIGRFLCEQGISPESIAGLGPRSPGRVIYALDGNLDSAAFRLRASERAISEPDGRAFNPRRWFCDDDELVQFNKKTYAFSNQWGGPRWRETMSRICSAYPQFKIEFSEVS